MAGRTYETSITLTARLASTFKAAIGGGTKALEQLNKQAAKLASADRASEQFAHLTSKVGEAQRRFNTAASVLDRMRAEANATGVATEQLAKEMALAEKLVARTEKELKKATTAADHAGDALRIAGVDTSKLTKEQHRLGAELAATTRKQERLVAAQAAHKRLFGDRGLRERLFGDPKEARIDKLGRQVGGLLTTAAKLGAAGLGAGVGLFALVKRAADTGDAVDDAAKRLHIGAVALQAFHAQGKLAGATTEDVDNGIGKLAINIGKVLAARKKGGGGFGAIEGLTIFPEGGKGDAGKDNPFKKIGLDVKVLKNLKPEEQIESIADAIAKLPTQSERSAAAVATLGKGGLKLLPILEKGGAALRKFREEGEKSGQFMSKDATEAASDFNDALEELTNRGVNSVINALGGTLLPVGTKTMKDLTKWVGENQDKIKAWAASAKLWIEGTAIPAVKSAGAWFLDTGGKIVGWVTGLADAAGGFGNLAIAYGAFKALQIVVTIGQTVSALGTLTAATWAGSVAWAAYLAPVAAAAIAIAAINELATDDETAIREKAAADWNAHEGARAASVAAARASRAAAVARSMEPIPIEGGRFIQRSTVGGKVPYPAAPTGPRSTPGGVSVSNVTHVTIQGNANEKAVKAGVTAGHADLDRQMKRVHAERQRVALAG